MMLELGGGAAAGGEDLIKDVTEATFMADVVEASQEQPVIVDFWAPWCGPCKTLGPALEAEVQAAGGKVKMAKVDIDQNQMLAGQMQIQSIPAVFAFYKGQPIDGFMGAKPASEIKAFIKEVLSKAGGGPEDFTEALAAADEMLEQGAVVDAAQTYAAILQEDESSGEALVGLIKAQFAAGEDAQAQSMMDNPPTDLANHPALLAFKAQRELADEAADMGDTAELEAKLAADANDHQSRYDLAVAQFAGGNAEAAIDNLLELFRRDAEWNEDAARQQLFKIFDSLGPKDPLAQAGRRKLSSIIFA